MDVRMTFVGLVLWFIQFVSGSVDPLSTAKKHLSSKPDSPRVKLGSPKGHEFEHKDSATEVVQELLHYYNRLEPPMLDKPTVVRLGVYINSFYSINEQTMDYSVSMYLRQAWRDPRLDFSRSNPSIKKIGMAENSWNEIWIPDTFFRNEKSASFHEMTVSNRLLRLNSTGNLWYATKISAVLSCPMLLQRYPFDTQSCPMMFESYGHTMDTMYFAWLGRPVDIASDLQLPQFTIVATEISDCSQNYTAGAFPCLAVLFILQRDIGYFLIHVYIPSILIVILSWVSFWINVDASSARVTIALLALLTMTMISGEVRTNLPRVSYIKAIDVWMIVCLLFVFTSLIEYAIVNVLARRPAPTDAPAAPRRMFSFCRAGKDKVRRQRPEDIGLKTTNDAGQEQHTTVADNLRNRDEESEKLPEVLDGKFQAQRVDTLSRGFFPLSFILFNLVYWTAYRPTNP